MTLAILALMACSTDDRPATQAQGPATTGAEQRTEIVPQQPPPPVDVLFVVDNSSSMADEQAFLDQNFPALVDAIVDSALDFHIGVVATDVQSPQYSGKLREGLGERYIETTTPDPQAVFAAMVDTLGVIVGSNEAGRAAAYLALEVIPDSPTNPGFLRDDASLHIVFVSDADDYTSDSQITKDDFTTWAETLKSGPPYEVAMHAIVPLQADPFCPATARPGFDYVEYAADFEGYSDSVCADDWTSIFDDVAALAARSPTDFPLLEVPLIDDEHGVSVAVRTGGDPTLERDFRVCHGEIEEGCEVVYLSPSNSISFLQDTPALGDDVVLEYSVATATE